MQTHAHKYNRAHRFGSEQDAPVDRGRAFTIGAKIPYKFPWEVAAETAGAYPGAVYDVDGKNLPHSFHATVPCR